MTYRITLNEYSERSHSERQYNHHMNNILQDYLNANFRTADGATIKEYFELTHGVDVKQEDGLFLFKYDQLNVKWSDVSRACRGTIMRQTPQGWFYCSRPWDKFFTYGDSKCGITPDTIVSSADYHLANKYDGTCIQMWYDDMYDCWRFSTLGTITTLQVNDTNKTFSELFHDIFIRDGWDTEEWCQEYTYLFELCTAENRIVTQYEADNIALLGARHNADGDYMAKEDLPRSGYPEFLKGTMTGAAIQDMAEAMALTTDYGINPEGFVLYKDLVPVAKFKNSRYLVLHNAAGGDKMHTINCIVDAFFAGNLDDIEGCLPTGRKKYAEYVREWWRVTCLVMLEYAQVLGRNTYATQKDYALAVQQTVSRPYMQSFFYKNRDKVEKHQVDLQTITDWSASLNNNKYTLAKEYINEVEAISLNPLA